MDPTSFRMFMAAASADSGIVVPAIGAAFQGGYYAGSISQNADGTATHALIVSDKSVEVSRQYRTTNNESTDAKSTYDGAANQSGNTGTAHPAFNYCANLTEGGYSDWYLPALYELEIAYYNLKPSSDSNNTSYGSNSYAVPSRSSNYSSSSPGQTSVTAFQYSSGSECFHGSNATGDGTEDRYHTSTEFTSDSTRNLHIRFQDGRQDDDPKTRTRKVRPFRKVEL